MVEPTYCLRCGAVAHPEQYRCGECNQLLGENSIAGRSRRKFKTFLAATAVFTAAGVAALLLTGSANREIGVSQEHCAMAQSAKDLSFDALAEQSADRDGAVALLAKSEEIWLQLEASYWPSKYSWSLPNGVHAYFEAVLSDTGYVRDLLSRGELVAAQLAERELTWKLRLLPQLCPGSPTHS